MRSGYAFVCNVAAIVGRERGEASVVSRVDEARPHSLSG